LLAGADAVYQKVSDAENLATWLVKHLGAPAGDTFCGLRHGDAHQLPLYEPTLTQGALASGPSSHRMLTLDFLSMAIVQMESMRLLYTEPSASALDRLTAFASLAEAAGALRLSNYVHCMQGQLSTSGLLHPALQPEYAAMLLDTVREVATSLLEPWGAAW